MPRQPPYKLVFAPQAIEHLGGIESKHHRVIEQTIDDQLTHTPEIETRNRKRLRQPAPYEASWELRCGPLNRFRVFYEINAVGCLVTVLAIGTKDRERLFFGGKEFQP